jgi:hypothetical protein
MQQATPYQRRETQHDCQNQIHPEHPTTKETFPD